MKIAVLLPCYNEEAAIAKVVQDFKAALPIADIYVYDNNSTDNTSAVAYEAGAIVRTEPHKGKGNVIRRMFADIDADIYIMADGDGTYDTTAAPALVQHLIDNNLDMIVGSRQDEGEEENYRAGHRFGNKMLNFVVHSIFTDDIQDMLSGYRVMSRRFVKSFPASSRGFEIETEMTIHALQLRVPMEEIPTRYSKRIEGTESKLSTYKDGIRILSVILFLFKEENPFWFFSLISFALVSLSLFLGLPVIFEFLETGLVPRFPTAILSLGIMLIAVISFVCGTILDSVSRGRLENKRLHYLLYSNASDKA